MSNSYEDESDEQLRRLERRIEETNNEHKKERLRRKKEHLVNKPKMK